MTAPVVTPSAAPAGIMGVKPPEPTTGIGTLQATRDITSQDYNKPMAERIAEKQALYKEQGVGAPGAEQREKLMAERANAADEAERTKWMRAAKFFASWGSTPGSTLVAGMAAVRESVPDMINDAKEAKKIRMELDKTIAGLDEAARLEKKGFVDEAYAEKMKLGEKMQALNIKIAEIQAKEEADTRSFAQRTKEAYIDLSGKKYTADMHLRGDELKVRSAAADRAMAGANAQDAKKFSQFQTAAEQERRVLADISRSESSEAHQKDLATIKQYGMLPKEQLDKNPQIKEQLDAAKSNVVKRQGDWNTQIETYKSNTDLAFSRAMGNQGAGSAGGKGGKGTPPPLSSFQR